MTKTNKTNKVMAIVIAIMMMVAAVVCTAAAQNSFAEAEGLAAHEQVMDDNEAAPEAEKVALSASEHVMDE